MTSPTTLDQRRSAGRGAAVKVIGATKVYGRGDTQVTALDDVTVDFASGAFTAIMGPSGSGKSTLMHCLAGLDSLSRRGLDRRRRARPPR